MKTSVILASALAAILLVSIAAVAVANSGNFLGSQNQGNSNQQFRGNQGEDRDTGDDHGSDTHFSCRTASLNENLTFSSLVGRFASTTGNTTARGNSTGTLNFKVSGIFQEGCTLSISGGSFTAGNTKFTVTGGTVILNHGGRSGVGTGTTSSGSFLIRIAGIHGNSTSPRIGAVGLDFKTGSSEYLIILGNPESSD